MENEQVKRQSEESSRCKNCGLLLRGPYCSHCGQKKADPITPLRTFTGDLLGHFLLFDYRLPRTLWWLLVPGKLTEVYLAGKRAPYVPPLRLFFFASFALFLLLAFNAGAEVSKITTGSNPAQDLVFLAQHYRTPLTFVVFLLVPVFAGLAKLLYRDRLYLAHVTFALHVHAFGAVITSVAVVISFFIERNLTTIGVLFLSMLACLSLYLLVALRRVYGETWLKTIVK